MSEGHKLLGCDVLLLAAGLGTRLRPLTETKPKPLIEFCGKPIIEWNLEMISRSGGRRVFINLHYLPEMIRSALGDGSRWGLEIEYVWEREILDTGGAIKNIAGRLNSELLMTLNSDIILEPTFDLRELVDLFDATRPKYDKLVGMLALIECAKQDGKIGILENGEICQVLDKCSPNKSPVNLFEYTGVQVLSRDIFLYMASWGSVFSITRDLYRSFMDASPNVIANLVKPSLASYVYRGFWTDLGTVDRLRIAEIEFERLIG